MMTYATEQSSYELEMCRLVLYRLQGIRLLQNSTKFESGSAAGVFPKWASKSVTFNSLSHAINHAETAIDPHDHKEKYIEQKS